MSLILPSKPNRFNGVVAVQAVVVTVAAMAAAVIVEENRLKSVTADGTSQSDVITIDATKEIIRKTFIFPDV
jgi:hypothetical protein